jgi:ABC-type glycerol-3-phosphate transport system substrate-binding protein
VALGEYRNITNAKDIISALFLQTGNKIMGQIVGGFGSTLRPASLSSIGAINFYTDFANPVKPDYSWNRALPNSLDMFVAGDLAFYFGFASEIGKIRDRNPNLNFDVTYFPQPKGAAVATTFGKMQGLAILRNSANSADALTDINTLTSSYVLGLLGQATGLPPVRLDMLTSAPENQYQAVFYNSAIRAQGWLDPNPSSSGPIFQSMIESITGGELEAGSAIDNAGAKLSSVSRGL